LIGEQNIKFMVKTTNKILLSNSTLSENFDKNLFENISWSWGNFHTHYEVATAKVGVDKHRSG